MIKILISGSVIKNNQAIAAAIIGGVEISVTVISVYSSEDALAQTRNTNDIDMFILDVNSTPEGGYIVADKIREKSEYMHTPILFMTKEPASRLGFDKMTTYTSMRKYNYISLPIDRLDVQSKVNLYIDDIMERRTGRRSNTLYLTHDNGEVLLQKRDITFAEINNRRCTLYTLNGKYDLRGMALQKLVSLIGDSDFIRCHKSFAVNTASIKEIIRVGKRLWKVITARDEECYISATHIDNVTDKYRREQSRVRSGR